MEGISREKIAYEHLKRLHILLHINIKWNKVKQISQMKQIISH